jgi:hypothetical protein
LEILLYKANEEINHADIIYTAGLGSEPSPDEGAGKSYPANGRRSNGYHSFFTSVAVL